MLTIPKIMDTDTAEHFYAWLESTVHISEQHETEELIFALITECPEYLVSRSWAEIRAIAAATTNPSPIEAKILTKAELIFKLEQAQQLLSDVYVWAEDNNSTIQGLMSCADGCIWEALDAIPDTVTNN